VQRSISRAQVQNDACPNRRCRSRRRRLDGKRRAIDKVMIERLWRTGKYQNIYLKEYKTGTDCFMKG
jgi:hypothetical protein